MKDKKSLRTLIISSVILLICIFSMSYKIMGLGFLQYVIVLFLTMKSTIGKRITVSDFAEHLDKEATTAWKEKKRFKASVYAVTGPMMAIGIIFVLIAIAAMLFLF